MSDAPRPLPPKKDVALALLAREPSVYVHLDPRRPGVSIPKWFTGQPQLVLQIGMNMPIPIPDLKVDDEGVSCTLSFSRTPFKCRIPWHAIWALVGDDQRGGMVWPEDVPPELAAQRPQKGPQPGSQKQEKPAKRPRGRLAAVGPEGGDGEARDQVRPRPRLEAAPPLTRDEGLVKDAEGGGEPAASPGPPRTAPQPVPAAAQGIEVEGEGEGPAPRPAGGKPKRELPPYLRVIK